MRLSIITSEFPPGPGGIGTHAYQLARNLVAMGWEVQVCSPQHYGSKGEIDAFNSGQPFEVVRLSSPLPGPLRLVDGARRIDQALRSTCPDVVLASGDRAVYVTALLTPRHGLPWVAVEHGRVPPRLERAIKRWAFASADAVVGVSRYSLERLTGDLGIIGPLTEVIHNGADPTLFKRLPDDEGLRFRREFGFEGKRLLLTVGNVSDRKGQDVVIKALPRVLEKIPDAHYMAVGLPTLRPELERLAEKLGVGSHVHFLGRLDEQTLLRCMNACDLFVMTSRHTRQGFEGFGIAVIEAALCGKCAVVSTSSGLVEAIAEGETGLAVPPEDPQLTADALVQLLEDDALRNSMGSAARRRALEEQTWDRRSADYGRLFERLLERTLEA